MRIAVIGATGPTGREIVAQAIVARHGVTAIARRPEQAGLPNGARVLRGDVTDRRTLVEAINGHDALICALGTKLSRKPTTLLSDGTANLVAAMKATGVSRLICITGIGAGDSRGHGGFFYDHIIQPLLLKEIYKDKDRQEEIVRASGLDWTIVRPATLSNGPATGSFRVITDMRGVTATKISRADVAAFVLKCAAERLHPRGTTLISY